MQRAILTITIDYGENIDTSSNISQYDTTEISQRNSDATLVNAEIYNEEDNTKNEEVEDKVSLVENDIEPIEEFQNEEQTNQEKELEEENKETSKTETISGNITSSGKDYFIESKLSRDTMYSQMIESYRKIIENANINETQKSISMQEITKINNTQNAIMIAENLIKNKGFENCIIFVNDESVNVIIESNNLTTEQIAQIQNIITREIQTDISNIHISIK